MWKLLFTYTEIRNRLVHDQGRIFILNKEGKHGLIEKIERMEGITLQYPVPQVAEIKIEDLRFVYTYVDAANEYLQHLISEILKQKFS